MKFWLEEKVNMIILTTSLISAGSFLYISWLTPGIEFTIND